MRKQLGLSLVELMISITLGLVLMTGVVQMFVSSKVVFNTQQGISRIQETGRLAIDFMARDIRMAGYYGCFQPMPGVALKNGTSLTISGLHGNFATGLVGYDDSTNLPDGVATDLGAVTPVPNDASTAAADANIIVIRSASKAGYVISADNDTNNVFAYTTATSLPNGCIDDVCVGDVMVASTCYKGTVFQVAGITLAGNLLTVNHADAWPAPVEYIAGNDLLPMNTTIYFLATRVNASGVSIPSLWQKTNNKAAQELLEGVEKMRITYAVNPNRDVYQTAAQITAANSWANVGSVRVELVVRSVENNVVAEPQPYTFAGVQVTPPSTDKYMRQVFTTTVTIRSRVH